MGQPDKLPGTTQHLHQAGIAKVIEDMKSSVDEAFLLSSISVFLPLLTLEIN